MSIVIYTLLAVIGLLALLAAVLVNRLAEVNKQLLIVVAGKDEKPEALRALVASNRPPQGKLKGIAEGKKKKGDEPKNTNYEMSIGIG